MSSVYEIIVIRLCIVRARLCLAPGLGLGGYLRIDCYPLLTVFVGPLVLEVGRL